VPATGERNRCAGDKCGDRFHERVNVAKGGECDIGMDEGCAMTLYALVHRFVRTCIGDSKMVIMIHGAAADVRRILPHVLHALETLVGVTLFDAASQPKRANSSMQARTLEAFIDAEIPEKKGDEHPLLVASRVGVAGVSVELQDVYHAMHLLPEKYGTYRDKVRDVGVGAGRYAKCQNRFDKLVQINQTLVALWDRKMPGDFRSGRFFREEDVYDVPGTKEVLDAMARDGPGGGQASASKRRSVGGWVVVVVVVLNIY
jgi:hypothetical protein